MENQNTAIGQALERAQQRTKTNASQMLDTQISQAIHAAQTLYTITQDEGTARIMEIYLAEQRRRTERRTLGTKPLPPLA